VIFFIALLIGYPWHILSALTVLYLLSLPLGWRSYRGYERAAAAQAAAQAVTPGDVPPSSPAPPFAPAVSEPDQDDRPARLN
jgi:CDP-diacylglycerol---serine O-phosphatidyltransferase